MKSEPVVAKPEPVLARPEPVVPKPDSEPAALPQGQVASAMSPVSSPGGSSPSVEDAVRDAVSAMATQTWGNVRAWQQTIEARVNQIERGLADLAARGPVAPSAPTPPQAAATAPAVQVPAARPAMHPPSIPVTFDASVGAAEPVVPKQEWTQPAQASAAVGAPPPFAGMAPSVAPPPMPDLPVGSGYDPDLPAFLDGGRRRKRMITLAIVALLLGMSALVALAIASQAAHGL